MGVAEAWLNIQLVNVWVSQCISVSGSIKIGWVDCIIIWCHQL